jgi:hypothetical protein
MRRCSWQRYDCDVTQPGLCGLTVILCHILSTSGRFAPPPSSHRCAAVPWLPAYHCQSRLLQKSLTTVLVIRNIRALTSIHELSRALTSIHELSTYEFLGLSTSVRYYSEFSGLWAETIISDLRHVIMTCCLQSLLLTVHKNYSVA